MTAPSHERAPGRHVLGDATPLELLLPDGRARAAAVCGRGCPHALRPAGAATEDTEELDLLILAPDGNEAANPTWRVRAAELLGRVVPDGMVYVLAPPPHRRRLRRLVRGSGRTSMTHFLHVPDAARSRFLVPAERATLRFAFATLVPVRRSNRPAVAIATRLPPATLRHLAPAVGFAARRPDARPLFGWLAADAQEAEAAIVAARSAPTPAATLHRFGRQAAVPSAVAKLLFDPAAAEALEANLRELGPAAGAAGANVPRPLPSALHARGGVLQSFVPGTRASLALSRDPRRLPVVLRETATWLERWHRATAAPAPFGDKLVTEWVLEPLGRIEQDLPGPRSRYRRRLERLCQSLAGSSVPLVAAHQDLTMSNLLLGDRLGVVDWEKARPDGLPLVDLFYAAADAVACVGGYADRAGAVRACFGAAGRHARLIESLRRRLVAALAIDETLSTLCFHACWLHHAANERRDEGGRHGPFRDIVAWLAATEDLQPKAAAR